MNNNIKLVHACSAWKVDVSKATAMRAAGIIGLENYVFPTNDTVFTCQTEADPDAYLTIDYQGIMRMVRAGKVNITNPQDARNILYDDLDRNDSTQYEGCRGCADWAGYCIEKHYGVQPVMNEKYQKFLEVSHHIVGKE